MERLRHTYYQRKFIIVGDEGVDIHEIYEERNYLGQCEDSAADGHLLEEYSSQLKNIHTT